MVIYRLIPALWAKEENPTLKVVEGLFTPKQIKEYNKTHNIYYLPNHPKEYKPGITVDGSMVDQFNFVFVDMDLKEGKYKDKEAFYTKLADIGITPSSVVDSGNGVHVYWKITDLDAMSYLKFQRRLMRLYNTDEAVGQLFQLMRATNTYNIKDKNNKMLCEVLYTEDAQYTAEEFDKLLPPLSKQDEDYCTHHYNKTYNLEQKDINVTDELPAKFGKLIRENEEAKQIFGSIADDRSKNDYRLGHIMLANDFTKEEAMQVLMNTPKASQRAPKHRHTYAENIVNKIWTFEHSNEQDDLSFSVEEILKKGTKDEVQGERLQCFKWADNTVAGFRRTQVMGLAAGSGVGKTTFALNLFKGFVQFHPELDHFIVPLEQPGHEIAATWAKMCGDNTALHKKVHIISNYDSKGKFRDLSLKEIKEHILKFKEETGKQVGCVVIDHIGVLSNNNRHGQAEGIKTLAKEMKGFAVETNTFLIMQTQTSREKAGIGDIELDKDAALGTSVFEHFCDWMVTLWQPLKRVYAQGAPTTMMFKFAKIRHKDQLKDVIKEDVCYVMYFDPDTKLVRPMTQDEEKSFNFYQKQAVNKRKADKKTEVTPYVSVRPLGEGDTNEEPRAVSHNTDSRRH